MKARVRVQPLAMVTVLLEMKSEFVSGLGLGAKKAEKSDLTMVSESENSMVLWWVRPSVFEKAKKLKIMMVLGSA